MTGDDRDLYKSFAALRREEESRVPPFSIHSLTSREHGRRQWSGKPIAATICLATLIAAAVWFWPVSRGEHEGSDHGRDQATASITSWKPATDFLLDTPGRELLEGVPAIGEWHGAAIGESRHLPRKKVSR